MFFNKEKGLEEILTLSENHNTYKKYSFIGAAICGSMSGIFLLIVIFGSENLSPTFVHWLYLFIGVWGVMAYVKVTEIYGLDLIANYINEEKIENELSCNGTKPFSKPELTFQLGNVVPSLLFWVSIGFLLIMVFS